ncbi:MAG TPA: adenosylcobinamide-phosphate synthase CbiB [Acidimicrobiales bacterium]|nr:adenosylcobinamide-phosphate synthase CbiB [Acidimicrobiales bacterium]
MVRPPDRRALARRALAAAAGVGADMVLGEPSVTPHPVSAFGTAMHRVERTLYADRRAAGVAHAATGLAIGVGAGLSLGPTTVSTAVATYLSVAQRALVDAAADVGRALDANDLPGARGLLPSLVGRDPSDLSEGEIARAVVESVAENTVDAIVAPAVWALAAGAPGTLGYRAVNTMDASVGYRNERYQHYGWASARLDDAANLIPARLTAALVMTVRPRSTRAVWRAVRQQAPDHPSPNSGVAEAAFAAALGLQLGGTNSYGDVVEERVLLGDGRPPRPTDIAAAITLCRDVSYALMAALVIVAVATW